MMYILTATQMKKTERCANEGGLPYLQMMENAGAATFTVLQEAFPSVREITVVAGKGNNGGDGFVTARLAAKAGLTVRVLLAEGEPATPDALTNFCRLAYTTAQVSALDDWDALPGQLVVDALYGTGFHGALRTAGQTACRKIAASGLPVLALDLPSGINADTGAIAEEALFATLTVSFDSLKPAHILANSLLHCGDLRCLPIGIPDGCHPAGTPCRILRIDEPDFGCEGAPDRQPLTDRVTLLRESGGALRLFMPDNFLYRMGLNVGSSVTLGEGLAARFAGDTAALP